MNKILGILALILAAIPAYGATDAIQGLCSKGGTKATISGTSSTNYLDGVIPSCTVTVYLTGTTTKATIFSDSLSTPLANPFTAVASTGARPGSWTFWLTNGIGVDVVMSGGIAPNTFPAPVTLVDLKVGGSGGGSGVLEVDTNNSTGITGGPITASGTLACAQASVGQFGCVKPDGSTIIATGGILTSTNSGSGTISGQANGVIPLASGATAITLQSHIDDGVTTASTITSSEPIAITGSNHYIDIPEQAAPANPTAGTDRIYTNSTTHKVACLTSGGADCMPSGGGGGSVNVNGSPVSSANFNDTTPAATTGFTNGTFQVSGSNVSVEVPNLFNPSGTAYLWQGDSRLMISTFNQTTATAASMNGTTVTITLNNVGGSFLDGAIVAGDQIQFFDNLANWAPSCLSWGNATVLTANSTTITVAQNSLGPVTCAGTQSGAGGVIQKANYLIPQITARQPYFLGHGTTYNFGVPAQTVAGAVTQYPTYVHPHTFAVTAQPCFLFQQLGSQDVLNGTAIATIKSGMQSLWALAHTDGCQVVVTTLLPVDQSIFNESTDGIVQVNNWLKSQLKQANNVSSGQYIDKIIDYYSYMPYSGDTVSWATGSEANHLNDTGTNTLAELANTAMAVQGSIPVTPKAQNINYSFVGADVTDQQTPERSAESQGLGFGVYVKQNFSSGSQGYFGLGMDNSTSPPTPFISGPTNHSAKIIAWKQESGTDGWSPKFGAGEQICWTNDVLTSTRPVDLCIKRNAAGIIGVGTTSASDFSGSFLGATAILTTTADPGSPTNGQFWYNSTTNLPKVRVNGVTDNIAITIASGTSALGTSAISSGTCATVVTTGATGVATTDTIQYTPNADPTGITGYGPSASGSLYIWAYPTTNNVSFKVCNNTSGSITPGALTLNWRVAR